MLEWTGSQVARVGSLAMRTDLNIWRSILRIVCTQIMMLRILSVLANPALINESYVRDGHLIRSVSNPKTYITPNNGDWTTIPNDTNIDEQTFLILFESIR